MKEQMLTLGDQWLDQYLAGAFLLHQLLGHSAPGIPIGKPGPEILISLLKDVADNKYIPGKYFTGEPLQANARLISAVPEIDLNRTYLMIGTDAQPPAGKYLSGVESGGILFEEPIWAMLAALALARTGLKNPLATPIATDNSTLWQNLGKVSAAIRSSQYKQEQFFGKAEPFKEGDSPAFALIPVKGDVIQKMRGNGSWTFSVLESLTYFQLYTTV